MLSRRHRSLKIFSDFNTLQFASVMAMVVFVLLLIFMMDTAPHHYATSVDLPKAWHPVSMMGANREDAMLIAVTRDGKIYFGSDRVTADSLEDKIREHLKDRDVERKVYIKADMRTHWGSVKPVLDAVRSAGLIRVAFLAYDRHLY